MEEKPGFIMCNCTEECPGFKDVNFWKLLNYGRASGKRYGIHG